MMKIAFQLNELNLRGTDRAVFDYVRGVSDLGHTAVVVTPRNGRHTQASEDRMRSVCPVVFYDDLVEATRGFDACYLIKYGTVDNKKTACPQLVHAVFDATEPHGHRYAAISKWLGERDGVPWVPFVVTPPDKPSKVVDGPYVVAYHGGPDSFDLDFAQRALVDALNARQDLVALFQGVIPFTSHPRAFFLPSSPSVGFVVHSAHALLHARSRGETFGSSVAEYASCGKRVITWANSVERAHLDHLSGDPGLAPYTCYEDLFEILVTASPEDPGCRPERWDEFSLSNVMKRFEEVFLK